MNTFLLLIGIFALATLANAGGLRKKKLVIFGDSISDNGNLKRYSNGAYPQTSRAFTNRFVWNEYVALWKNYKLINNAYGGAAVGPGNTFFGSLPVPTLSQQILNLEFQNDLPCKGNCIHAIMIGPNDIVNARNNDNSDANAVVDLITSGIEKAAIQLLEKYGADYVVISTLYPSSATPLMQKLGKEAGNVTPNPLAVVKYIEGLVKKNLETIVKNLQIKYNSQTIKLWDVGAVIEDIESKDDYLLEYCVEVNGEKKPECNSTGKYYWWDAAHPSHRMHKKMARDFIKSVLNDE